MNGWFRRLISWGFRRRASIIQSKIASRFLVIMRRWPRHPQVKVGAAVFRHLPRCHARCHGMMCKRSRYVSDRCKWLDIVASLFVLLEVHLQIERLFYPLLSFILICWPKDVRSIPEIVAEFVLGMAFPSNMAPVLASHNSELVSKGA